MSLDIYWTILDALPRLPGTKTPLPCCVRPAAGTQGNDRDRDRSARLEHGKGQAGHCPFSDLCPGSPWG